MNLFGSNSNWRGPVWLAVNYLLVEKLGGAEEACVAVVWGAAWTPGSLSTRLSAVLHKCLGDNYTVEFPSRSGQRATLGAVTHDLAQRMLGLFRTKKSGGAAGGQGIRPTDGDGPAAAFFSTHPRFAPYIPFYEYFDGDTGRGLGASHQTGWTALVAKLLQHHSDARTGPRGHWLATTLDFSTIGSATGPMSSPSFRDAFAMMDHVGSSLSP